MTWTGSLATRSPGRPRPAARVPTHLARLLAAALAVLALAAGAASAARVDDLLARLDSDSVRERRRALVELADRGSMDEVPAIVESLRDPDASVRELAQQTLWSIWMSPGDEEAEALLQRGTALLNRGRVRAAVPFFEQVIERLPDYAEGYNKRATALYYLGEYEASLADIEETLARNPWHFGALSGAGLCLIELERFREALDYFERALEVNPNMERVREMREALRDRLRKPMV